MRKQLITAILIVAAISIVTSQVASAKTVHLKAGEKVVKVKTNHHHKHHAKVVREVVVEKTVKHKKHRASSMNDEDNGFNSRDVCNFVDSPRAAFEFGCF